MLQVILVLMKTDGTTENVEQIRFLLTLKLKCFGFAIKGR